MHKFKVAHLCSSLGDSLGGEGGCVVEGQVAVSGGGQGGVCHGCHVTSVPQLVSEVNMTFTF